MMLTERTLKKAHLVKRHSVKMARKQLQENRSFLHGVIELFTQGGKVITDIAFNKKLRD